MIEIPIKPFPEKITQDFLDKCLNQKDGYNRHGVIHDVEFLDYLRKNYSKFKSRDDYRMYNLFNTTRYFTSFDSISNTYFNDFKKRHGFKDMSHYILEYNEGAYAKVHMDNASELTLVTLIDLDHDTIGGDVIAYGASNELQKKSKENMVITQQQWKNIDKKDRGAFLSQKPVIAQLDVNETISYGNNAMHGVSELRRGRRVALIQWCYFNFTRADKGLD